MAKPSKPIGQQFADITALLEDAHGLAVEGQGHNLTSCEVRCLLQCLLFFSARLTAMLKAIPTHE